MTVETVAKTAVGRERPHNEDAVRTDRVDGWTVLVVADGMGGHSAGDVASEEAIEEFFEFLERHSDNGTIEDPDETLREGVAAANDHLQELVAQDSSLDGMGTTFVGALVRNGSATIINVGDSRAYHVADGDIEQVTTDQSLVQQLVEQGTIEPEEADDHPQKHVLAQALGTDEEVEPDIERLELDGTLLLCSDGLSDEVPDEELTDLVQDADSLGGAASRLVDRANELDGSDNISVVLGREGNTGTEGRLAGLRERMPL